LYLVSELQLVGNFRRVAKILREGSCSKNSWRLALTKRKYSISLQYEGGASCQRDNMTLIVNRVQEYVFRGCVEMAVSRDN